MVWPALRKLLGRGSNSPKGELRSARYRPRLDVLESRLLLSTFLVDDDLVQCPGADFTSINAAVAAAQPGDQIIVCPGLYLESVTVNKDDLRLRGAGPAPGDRTGNPLNEAVVQGGSSGFNVVANEVLIQGFTVQNNSIGILVSGPFSSAAIAGNLVSNNAIGISLANQANHNLISGNRVTHNSSDGIRLANADFNTVAHNQAMNNNVGIDLLFGADSNFVAHNQAMNNTTGIRLFSNTDFNSIAHNQATNNVVGIELSALTPLSGAEFNTIAHNDATNNSSDGIRLSHARNNILSHNKSLDNGRDGIRVNASSTGNLVEHNIALGNGEHDCHDDSVGAGTAGTANFWRKNKGRTENVVGLCELSDDEDNDD